MDLRTDLVPGVEFASVETEIVGGGIRSQSATAAAGEDFTTERRIAEFAGLKRGPTVVVVYLRDASGDTVQSQRAVVTVEARTAVTIVVTRNCRDVSCDGGGSSAQACLGERCVDARCAVVGQTDCPERQCEGDADCPPPADCAVASCRDGVCLALPIAGFCMPTEWCEPELGCQAEPETSADDASVPPLDGQVSDGCPRPLSGTGVRSEAGEDVRVVATGGEVAAVWRDTTGSIRSYFGRFDATGRVVVGPVVLSRAWTSPRLLHTGSEYLVVGGASFARVDPSGTELAVVTPDLFGASGGRTTGAGASGGMATALWTGDALAVVWASAEAPDAHVWFARVALDGNLLSAPTEVAAFLDDGPNNLELPDDVYVGFPTVAFSGDGYGVTWIDNSTGTEHVGFRALDGAGSPLGQPILLTEAPEGPVTPWVGWVGDAYAVAWGRAFQLFRQTPSSLAFRRVTADGNVGPLVPLAGLPGASLSRRPLIAGDELFFLWINALGDATPFHVGRVGPRGQILGLPVTYPGGEFGVGDVDFGWDGREFLGVASVREVGGTFELSTLGLCPCGSLEGCAACLELQCAPCQVCDLGTCMPAFDGERCGPCQLCSAGACAPEPEGSACFGGTCNDAGCCLSCELRRCGEADGCGGQCTSTCCNDECMLGETLPSKYGPCGDSDRDECLEAWSYRPPR